MLSIDDIWNLWKGKKRVFSTTELVHVQSTCVYKFTCQSLTESNSLILRSLSLDGLFDDSLSGAVKTTLPTFDPVRQLDLFQFRVKPLEVSALKQ